MYVCADGPTPHLQLHLARHSDARDGCPPRPLGSIGAGRADGDTASARDVQLVADHMRLSLVLYPLSRMVRKQGLDLAVRHLPVDDQLGRLTSWAIVHLVVPGHPRGLCLPTRRRWCMGPFEVMLGAREDLPFHLLFARFELLQAMTTVLAAQGWPMGFNITGFDVVSDDVETRLLMRATALDRDRGGGTTATDDDDDGTLLPPWLFTETETPSGARVRLLLIDSIHDVMLQQYLTEGEPVPTIPLTGIVVAYDCPLCRHENATLSTHGNHHCTLCGLALSAAWLTDTHALRFSVRHGRRVF